MTRTLTRCSGCDPPYRSATNSVSRAFRCVEEIGLERREGFGLHRLVRLAPPHGIFGLGVADGELVLGGTAGVLAGLDDHRTVLGELAFAARHCLLDQRCGRQVPVDGRRGLDALGFQPVRGGALAHSNSPLNIKGDALPRTPPPRDATGLYISQGSPVKATTDLARLVSVRRAGYRSRRSLRSRNEPCDRARR